MTPNPSHTTPNQTQKQAMSDSRELQDPTGQPRGSRSDLPTKTLYLSRQEAASWLLSIDQWLSEQDVKTCPELESLRLSLEDACWLARWKRESVNLELCPAWLPGILQALVQVDADEPSSEMAETLEAIIGKLSAVDAIS